MEAIPGFLIILFILAFVVLIVVTWWRGRSNLPHKFGQEFFPYSKKRYLMTRTENEFFKTLERVVGADYYIFPQINLDKIIYTNGHNSYKNPYYNMISRKSIDYLLCDKRDISPVLVIELDDYTHQRVDRQKRDGFVDQVFDRCGIAILHIHSLPQDGELREQIASKIKM